MVMVRRSRVKIAALNRHVPLLTGHCSSLTVDRDSVLAAYRAQLARGESGSSDIPCGKRA
jgi:hypothetical protein